MKILPLGKFVHFVNKMRSFRRMFILAKNLHLNHLRLWYLQIWPDLKKKHWIHLSTGNTDLLLSASFICTLWLAAWYQMIWAPSSVVIWLFLRKYSSIFSLQDPKMTAFILKIILSGIFLNQKGTAYVYGEKQSNKTEKRF